MNTKDVLLLSCYELGHQPLSLAWPMAFLRETGRAAEAVDLSVAAYPAERVKRAAFVGIAVPMHTALRLGVQAARRVRADNPAAHVCFFGLYAWLNADYLLDGLADSVIGGEYEQPLVELIDVLARGGDLAAVPGLSTPASRSEPHLARLRFPIPDRTALPQLDRYARWVHGTRQRIAGYVEASRGCLHTCLHCPIVPIYDGRFFVVPADTVLADIRQQVAAGAEHVTFGDPDFLNGPGHALKVTRALHAEFPGVSFDFTAKVEHVLKQRDLFAEFAELGCSFVTSAIESVSNRVLRRLNKGHTFADIDEALHVLDMAGIPLLPTLVAFTPWTTLDDYLAQIEFIHARGLIEHVPPVQLAIRLLVPPGSALARTPDAAEWLGEFDAEAFTYRWTHPDPRMDRLYEDVSARVELADRMGEPAWQTYEAIREMAYAAAGRPAPAAGRPAYRPAPPRLTENWFC